MRTTSGALIGLTALAAGALVADASAQCQYEVVQLDYPIGCAFGSPVITNGSAVNNQGVVVGSYKCPLWTHTEAFRWSAEEGFTTLPRPAGVCSSWASDISENGVIVGTFGAVCSPFRGYVYQDGQYTELPPLKGPYSWANAISDDGAVVVGARNITDSASPSTAFIWSVSEGFLDLGLMSGGGSSASDIGPSGAVVGCTACTSNIGEGFLWHDGQLTMIGPIPGGMTSVVNAVGSDQALVGSGAVFGSDVVVFGFVWRGGEFTLIDPVPGYDHSGARDINYARQVTGSSSLLTNPNERRGYLWQHGVTHDLNDLVPAKTVTVKRGRAINDLGQVLAHTQTTNTVLLTPIGQPVGDLDIDCAVGVTDFLRLLAEWGQADSPADLDGDGTVDLFDLIILLDNWGT